MHLDAATEGDHTHAVRRIYVLGWSAHMANIEDDVTWGQVPLPRTKRFGSFCTEISLQPENDSSIEFFPAKRNECYHLSIYKIKPSLLQATSVYPNNDTPGPDEQRSSLLPLPAVQVAACRC